MTNYVLLCGGIGKRNENYSLPKPLNMINGKHLIEYVINDIPSDNIHVIYNYILKRFNFEYIVRNLFKSKTFSFYCIDYITRGPVETALIGCINLNIPTNNNVIFIDNDNIHDWSEVKITEENTDFLYYSHDFSESNRFSFIQFDENHKINKIKEKERISNNYCCGIYGFKNVIHFIDSAKLLIEKNIKQKNEFYFSSIYNNIINKGETVVSRFMHKSKHLGSKVEIIENYVQSSHKLRICFDLDNTLVTYPEVPGDYKTVKPIQENIDLCNDLHRQGHTIIVFTARRMLTHNHNIGKVIKDIGRITFDTLDDFSIQYDEILFGKPIADIYIDDRALNPLVMDIGFFGLKTNNKCEILNKIENNKYNTIIKKEGLIEKTGPNEYITGEIYFYENIKKFSQLVQYFPKYYGKLVEITKSTLSIEYIEGIPLYYFLSNKTFTEGLLSNLLNVVSNIHSAIGVVEIDENDLYDNYINKLKTRFGIDADYPFENKDAVFTKIIDMHEQYIAKKCYKIVPVIHGDLWFSNILLSYTDSIYLIDMKGKVGSKLTLNGDIMYDYGKIYQSLLGFDLILNGKDINVDVSHYREAFEAWLKHQNIEIHWVKVIALGLISGTLHFIDADKKTIRDKVWNLIVNLTESLS